MVDRRDTSQRFVGDASARAPGSLLLYHRHVPIRHVVKRGECLSSIAHTHGFFWETLWEHTDNGALREKRGDPNCLAPGDVVFIPDQRIVTRPAATDQRHVFRLRTTPVRFRLRIVVDDEPLAGVPYVLCIDEEKQLEGATDADGWVDELVAAGARRGVLAIGAREVPIAFRHLAPLETPEGPHHRLTNLGYLPTLGPVTPRVLRDAIERFQADHDLAKSGELDAATLDALHAQHRSEA